MVASMLLVRSLPRLFSNFDGRKPNLPASSPADVENPGPQSAAACRTVRSKSSNRTSGIASSMLTCRRGENCLCLQINQVLTPRTDCVTRYDMVRMIASDVRYRFRVSATTPQHAVTPSTQTIADTTTTSTTDSVGSVAPKKAISPDACTVSACNR